MKNPRRTFFIPVMGVVILSSLLIACSRNPTYYINREWPAFNGYVLEQGTNKPIEGAIVVARWEADAWTTDVCMHVKTTTTDAQGKYEFPAWRNDGKFWKNPFQRIKLLAYKPEYEEVGVDGPFTDRVTYATYLHRHDAFSVLEETEPFNQNIDKESTRFSYTEEDPGRTIRYLNLYTGTAEDRIAFLNKMHASCDNNESSRNILPFYEARYLEARQLAKSNEDLVLVFQLLKDIEKIKLGSDEAWKNYNKRTKDIR